MKKFTTIIFILFCFCVKAQTNHTGTTSATGTFGGEFSIPVIVTTRFAQDHPNISANWSKDDDNYAAEYRDATTNLENVSVYDQFGNLIKNDVELEASANPKNICSYYSKRFPEDKLVVWKSTDAKGKTSYYTKREYIIICFDKKGKFVTTKDNKQTKKATQLTEKSK
jgi:hypothetical protein